MRNDNMMYPTGTYLEIVAFYVLEENESTCFLDDTVGAGF